MIFFYIFSFILSLQADVPNHWSYIYEIHDRHEFYQNDEIIVKPKDSWQTLFSLTYIDRDLTAVKDCVFFKVPGVDSGTIKIKTIHLNDKCDDYLLKNGEKEIAAIKSLKYSIKENGIELTFIKDSNKKENLTIQLNKKNKKLQNLFGLSSAEYKSAKFILLAPKTNLKPSSRETYLKVGSECLEVNDDCEIKSPSQCHRCEKGWYEIPNGCSHGPKYCGQLSCGGKNQPACRRGMKWQKSNDEFDCRTNSTFAYCSRGLSIQCEGRKAYCR